MGFFRKSGRALSRENVLRQQYAFYFNSDRLFKGVIFSLLGWVLVTTSTVAFQDLVISNSIFVTCFYIFAAASVPILIAVSFQPPGFFICGKPKYIILRAVLAVVHFYIHGSSRIWLSRTSNNILFSLDSLFVPLFIYLLFKKKLAPLTWVGLLLSFVGLGILHSYKIDILSFAGLVDSLICLFSSVSMAWLIILSSFIIRHDPPLRQALYTFLIGAAVSGVAALISGWEQPSNIHLLYMVIQGLIYSCFLMLFLKSADCIEPHVVAALSHCVPVFIILINGALKFYKLSWMTYIGSSIIFLGIIFVLFATRFQKRDEDFLLV